MKTLLALLTVAIIGTGCSISRISGPDFSAVNYRWFWETRDFGCEVPTAHGPVKVTLGGSNTDKAALQILGRVLIDGLTTYRGMTTAPQLAYVTNYVAAPAVDFPPVPPASKGLQ